MSGYLKLPDEIYDTLILHKGERGNTFVRWYFRGEHNLLVNVEYTSLTMAQRGALDALFGLAAHTKNRIPNKQKWLNNVCHGPVPIKELMKAKWLEAIPGSNQDDSNVQPDCNQDGTASQVKLSQVKLKEKSVCVFDLWNEQGIVRHRVFSEGAVREIEKILKTDTLADIEQSIKDYATVIKSSQYYFKHKWSLELFLKRGYHKHFKPELKPLENFLIPLTTEQKKEAKAKDNREREEKQQADERKMEEAEREEILRESPEQREEALRQGRKDLEDAGVNL